MGRGFGLTAAASLLSAALAALVGGPARAGHTTTTLPLAAATDVVTAGGHVFVSGGPASTKIVVTSSAGVVQKTIDGLGGPAGLVAGRDGGTVYASLRTANAVVAISVRTLKVVRTYPTGSGTCPAALAQSGRWLYFGYGCAGGQWTSGVGRLDLAPAPPTPTPTPTPTATATAPPTATALNVTGERYYSPPLLAAGGNVLVVGQPDLSPTTVTSFRVSSGGSLTRVSANSGGSDPVTSNLQDMATTATGAQLFTAAGAPYVIQQYATTDLTELVKSYPTAAYPDAVALSADGTFLAGGSDAASSSDVYLFRDGARAGNIELEGTVLQGGLAWGPDDRRLYAVTFDRNDPASVAPVLHVLTLSG